MTASVSLVDTDDWLADTRISYDTVADSYADMLREGLDDPVEERHAGPAAE